MNTVHIYVLIIHILYVCVSGYLSGCAMVYSLTIESHIIRSFQYEWNPWLHLNHAGRQKKPWLRLELSEHKCTVSWRPEQVLFFMLKFSHVFFFLPKTQATGYGSPVNSFSPHKNSSAPALHSNSGSAHTSVSDVSGPSLLHTQSSSKPAAYIHWHCERWVTHRKWLSAELWHTWMSDHALCCCSAARTHFYSVFKNEIIHAN